MQRQSYSVGIDIGTQRTRVVVCDGRETGGVLPNIIGYGESITRGMRHGYPIVREDVARSLKEAIARAEKSAGLKIRQARLCIGGIGIACEYATGSAVITRADSVISKLDVDKAINEAELGLDLKNKTMLHASPLFFKVDGEEIAGHPEGVVGMKLEVHTLFITCFSQHVDDTVAICNDMGIKVTQLHPTPMVSNALLLTDLQRNLGCVLIDMGAETTSVSVYENNMLTSVYVFGIGSLDITKDIALGLRISPEDAENLKLGVVSFQQVPKRKLDEIIDARLGDIFDLINKYLKKIGRSGLLPAGAILIGGGSAIAGIETIAKNSLKIPARAGTVELPTLHSLAQSGKVVDVTVTPAYAAAIQNVTKHSKLSPEDTDNFITYIKKFFKQLMP
jgi:cell division protein FtsA